MTVKDNLSKIKTFRRVVRIKDIITVLVKHGFDSLVEGLGLPGGILLKKITKIKTGLTIWERIRHAVEELGPTYIKFGQILSIRPDLIPRGLLDEFKELREDVYHEEFELIKNVIENSFKTKLEKLFSEFDEIPVAAGSLAQVHRAVLRKTGETVAVKVQRPGIRLVIKSDLEILQSVAKMAHERIEALQPYYIPGIIEEIRKHIIKEIDFTSEANNIQIFKENFDGVEDVHAPEIYPDYSNHLVLTMEFIQGEKIDELKDIDGRKQKLARRGLEIVQKQILLDGFFHADPHSGNIRILENDVICLLDWGMVGRLTIDMRASLVNFMLAVMRKDSKKLLNTTLKMAFGVPPLLDRTALESEILFILDKIHSKIIKNVNLGLFLMDLVSLFRRNHIQMRPDYVYMVKALMAIEGTGKELYPDFNLMAELKRVNSRLLLKKFSIMASEKIFLEKTMEAMKMTLNFPYRIDKFLNLAEGGKLSIDIVHKGIEAIHGSIRILGNRVAAAIVIAALVVGSSMIITSGMGPFLFGYPILGIAGYVFSAFIGFWLVIHMIVKRKI